MSWGPKQEDTLAVVCLVVIAIFIFLFKPMRSAEYHLYKALAEKYKHMLEGEVFTMPGACPEGCRIMGDEKCEHISENGYAVLGKKMELRYHALGPGWTSPMP